VEESRTAERAWISYRDLWLDFARLRYPALSPDQVKIMLTGQRIKAIQDIMKGVN
jgi:hypothetical protein